MIENDRWSSGGLRISIKYQVSSAEYHLLDFVSVFLMFHQFLSSIKCLETTLKIIETPAQDPIWCAAGSASNRDHEYKSNHHVH